MEGHPLQKSEQFVYFFRYSFNHRNANGISDLLPIE